MIIYDNVSIFSENRSVYIRQCGRNTKYIVAFHCNSGYANAPQCYEIRILSVLLVISVAQSSQKVPYKWSCPLLVLLV